MKPLFLLKKRGWFIATGAVVLVGYSIFFFAAWKPFSRDMQDVEARLKQREGEIGIYWGGSEGPPARERFDALSKEVERLKIHYFETRSLIKFEEELPIIEKEHPGLKFKEELKRERDALLARAEQRNVKINKRLGIRLGAALPPRGEIPYLKQRLKVAREITRCGIGAGLASIDLLDFTSPLEGEVVEVAVAPFEKRVKISLRVTSNLTSLVSFLHRLASSSLNLFIIEVLDVNLPDPGSPLQANIELYVAWILPEGGRPSTTGVSVMGEGT